MTEIMTLQDWMEEIAPENSEAAEIIQEILDGADEQAELLALAVVTGYNSCSPYKDPDGTADWSRLDPMALRSPYYDAQRRKARRTE